MKQSDSENRHFIRVHLINPLYVLRVLKPDPCECLPLFATSCSEEEVCKIDFFSIINAIYVKIRKK